MFSLSFSFRKKKKISHADPLFFNRSILKIDDLYEQSLRIFAFKLFKNLLPQEIISIFPKVDHNHNTRGAKNNFFVVLADKRSIKSIAPACWNSLPMIWKQCPSVLSFKNTLKNDLIASYASFSCLTRNCQSCLVNSYRA